MKYFHVFFLLMKPFHYFDETVSYFNRIFKTFNQNKKNNKMISSEKIHENISYLHQKYQNIKFHQKRILYNIILSY